MLEKETMSNSVQTTNLHIDATTQIEEIFDAEEEDAEEVKLEGLVCSSFRVHQSPTIANFATGL